MDRFSMRKGVGLAEVVVATIVLAAALLPIARSFSAGWMRTTVSGVQYMALHVARAKLEEARHMPFSSVRALAHADWRPATGNVLGALAAARRASARVTNDRGLMYPAGYGRIFTKVSVDEVAPRMLEVTVDVMWQENGVTARAPEALSRFRTLIVDQHVVPEEAL